MQKSNTISPLGQKSRDFLKKICEAHETADKHPGPN